MVTTARLKAGIVFERGIMPLAISIAIKSLQIAHSSHPLKALFSMSTRNSASDPSGWSLSARTVGSYLAVQLQDDVVGPHNRLLLSLDFGGLCYSEAGYTESGESRSSDLVD